MDGRIGFWFGGLAFPRCACFERGKAGPGVRLKEGPSRGGLMLRGASSGTLIECGRGLWTSWTWIVLPCRPVRAISGTRVGVWLTFGSLKGITKKKRAVMSTVVNGRAALS